MSACFKSAFRSRYGNVGPLTQSSQKRHGSCAVSVCLRQISLTSSYYDVIHSHCHGRPCAVSGCLPATSSVSSSSTSQSGIVAPAATNHPSPAPRPWFPVHNCRTVRLCSTTLLVCDGVTLGCYTKLTILKRLNRFFTVSLIYGNFYCDLYLH